MRIPPHNRFSPYHKLTTSEKASALVGAYRELKLIQGNPPTGIHAERLEAKEYTVRFVRLSGGV